MHDLWMRPRRRSLRRFMLVEGEGGVGVRIEFLHVCPLDVTGPALF